MLAHSVKETNNSLKIDKVKSAIPTKGTVKQHGEYKDAHYVKIEVMPLSF